MTDQANTPFFFGDFEIDFERRLLLRRGEVVALKGKGFDLLQVLVENRGELMTKNDLLDRVWENQFVEENNLTVHIAALRKALGEKKNANRYVVTVPGKGYRFVANASQRVNGDVVVESRKFQKIVVSEELEEQTFDGDDDSNQFRSEPVPYRRRLTPARKTGLAVFAMIAFGVLGIAGAYAFRAGIVRDYFAAGTPFREHQVTQLTTNGKVGSAALSPDGELFAYVIDDVGSKSLWLGKIDGGNHLELRPAADAVYHTLAFSPDNSQLYFSVRDKKSAKSSLYTIPVFGGVATKLKDDVEGFALSPDGKQIATGRHDGENDVLSVASLEGKDRRDVASFPKAESFLFDSISWSPDAEHLAVSAIAPGNIYRHELAIVETASGVTTRTPIENYRNITKTSWLRDGNGLIVTAIEEGSYSSVTQYRLVHVSYPDGSATEITADRSN